MLCLEKLARSDDVINVQPSTVTKNTTIKYYPDNLHGCFSNALLSNLCSVLYSHKDSSVGGIAMYVEGL